MVTRASLREAANKGVSQADLDTNRRFLLTAAAEDAVAALDDAATAIAAVEAAPDLATAQAAVSGVGATVSGARDALDTQLV